MDKGWNTHFENQWITYTVFIPISIMHKAFQDISSICKGFCKNVMVTNVNHPMLVIPKHNYQSTWKLKCFQDPIPKEHELPTHAYIHTYYMYTNKECTYMCVVYMYARNDYMYYRELTHKANMAGKDF